MRHAAALAGMGLITSVLAPLVVLLSADSRLWRRVTAPAPVLLGAFLLLHAAITVATIATVPMPVMIAARAALLAGAVAFWLPVLGPDHRRMSAGGRSLYLYVAAPTLDLSAVFVIGSGDETGGLAMIVAMLPIGFTAMALTWRWITSEERAAREAERSEPTAGPSAPTRRPSPPITRPSPASPASPATTRPSPATTRPSPASPATTRPSPATTRASPATTRARPATTRARPVITRRGLQIGLSLCWLSAAILQAQPAMFTARFGRQVLLPAADGQPAPLAVVIRICAHLTVAHPALANTCFAAIEALLAAGVAWPKTARPALAASIGWSAAIWVVGEGLGGLAAGMGSVLTGGPGAAALYGLIAVAAMPKPGGSGKGTPPPQWLAAVWAALWLTLLVTGPWPGQTTGADLRSQLTGPAASLPAGWAHEVERFAALAGGRPIAVVAALVVAEAIVALAALRPGVPRAAAAGFGAAMALASWACGGGAGGLFSGMATDVGTGPMLVLLAVAVASAARAPRSLGAQAADRLPVAPREPPARPPTKTAARPLADAPAEAPGQAPAELPGTAPAEPPGQTQPAEPPATAPAEPPGRAPAEPPGRAPAKPPGQTQPAEPPATAPAEPPGRAPAKPPGHTQPATPPDRAPAKPPGHTQPAEPLAKAAGRRLGAAWLGPQRARGRAP